MYSYPLEKSALLLFFCKNKGNIYQVKMLYSQLCKVAPKTYENCRKSLVN